MSRLFILQLLALAVIRADNNIHDVVLQFNVKHKTELNIFLNLHQETNTEVRLQFEETAYRLSHIPKLIKTDVRSITSLRKLFTEQSLTVAWVTWDQLNNTIVAIGHLLWNLRYKEIILIYHQAQDLQQELKIISKMCWHHGFTSVLIWINPENFFTYHPYPSVAVKKLNNVSEFGDKSHLNNFHLYTWIQPAVHFPPRFTSYTNRHGQQLHSGYLHQIISVFLTHHNGSINYYFVDMWNSTFEGMAHLIVEKGYSFLPMMSWYMDGLAASNTLYLARTVFLVPSSREIAESLYLLITFDEIVWLSIIFTGFMFFILIIVIVYKDKNIFGVGNADLEAFKIILFLNVSALSKKSLNNFMLSLLFLFTGLFLTNYYSSSLSSLYTSKVHEPELVYLADIERTNLRIFEYTLDVIVYERLKNLPPIVYQRLYTGNDTELFINRQSLNMTYIYTGNEDIIDYFLLQQMNLKKPIAKKLNEVYQYRPHFVHVAPRCPLLEQFNRYLRNIMDSGLYNKFLADAYWEGILNGDLRILLNPVLSEALNVEYFRNAFALLAIGWFSALVAFVVENIWRRRNLAGFVRHQLSVLLPLGRKLF